VENITATAIAMEKFAQRNSVGRYFERMPAAYTEMENWLSHFEATFPDKAKKMRDYSERQGWSQQAHAWYWPTVILRWLQKQAPSNARDNRSDAALSRSVRLIDGLAGYPLRSPAQPRK
jgi:hypothetical protein